MSEQAKDSIAFVPDFSVFSHATVSDVLGIVKDTDYPANSVCLPIVQMGGLPFPSKIGSEEPIFTTKSKRATAVQEQFHQMVTGMMDQGLGIYFYVNPSMEFLNVPPAHVLDIRNVGSPSACLNKSITQRVIVSAVVAAFKHIKDAERTEQPIEWSRMKGVAIDITDLWGMSGSGASIHPACFCSDCRKYFAKNGLHIENFETSPSPFLIALRPSPTGVSYIDNFSKDESPSSIVGKSTMRGFADDFTDDDEKMKAASLLSKYMNLRHQMVQDSLNSIFEKITEGLAEAKIELPESKRIIVAEGAEYNWTGGIFLENISSNIVDEVWFDPTEKTSNTPKNLKYRYFTSTRSTYFLNAFLQIIANSKNSTIRATTELGTLSDAALKKRIEQRGGVAVGRIMNNIFQLGLAAVEDENFNGFVRPTINAELATSLALATKPAPSPLTNADTDTDTDTDLDSNDLMEMLRQQLLNRARGL